MPSCSTVGAAELESQQLDLGLVAVVRTADDADELVQVGQGDEVTFQDLGALLGLAQFDSGCGG